MAGFNVQAVMERTGIAAYNSTYRRGDDEQIPEEYLVYSQTDSPDDYWDDEYHGVRHLVTVHLCSRGNPMDMAGRVCTEMAKDGLWLVSSQDAYDEDADMYIKVLQFLGREDA